jgi:hypothetical protein
MQSVNSNKQEKKPLSVKGIEAMKPDQIKADTGENAGLRIKCAKSGVKAFFYRYTSPVTEKLKQIPIGTFLIQRLIKLECSCMS